MIGYTIPNLSFQKCLCDLYVHSFMNLNVYCAFELVFSSSFVRDLGRTFFLFKLY